MPQYLSPGVYVEEVDAGPKPIEGVSTSVAGAVGVTARGPDTGKPVLVTSFAEYLRTFGGPIDVDAVVEARWSDDDQLGEFWTFPLAVKGFFDNGGQQLYVRRVTAKNAVASQTSLGEGVMTFVNKNAPAGATQLKLESLIGIQTGTAITLSIDGTTLSITPSAYDSSTGTITFSPPLTNRVQANRDFVTVMSQAGTSMKIVAKSAGAWGDQLQVRARPMDAGAFALMADPAIGGAAVSTTITADVAADVKFTVANATGIVAGDWIVVNGKQYLVPNAPAGNVITVAVPLGNPSWANNSKIVKGLDPNGTTTATITADATGATFVVDDVTNFPVNAQLTYGGSYYAVTAVDAANKKLTVGRLLPWNKGWTVIRIRIAAKVASLTPSLLVWNASSLYKNAFVEIEDTIGAKRYYGQVTDITSNKVTISINAAVAPSFTLLEGQRIHLIEGQFDVLYSPTDGSPQVLEQIKNVRFAEAEPGDPMFVGRLIGNESNLIDVASNPAINIGALGDFPMAADAATPPNALTWAKLGGGDDAFGSLDVDQFVGTDEGPGKRSGIQALEDIDDISITLAPSITSFLVQSALIQQAETLKYRFAIIDPPPVKPTAVDVIDKIRAFRSNYDSKYAALYFPRIEVRDPFSDTTVALGPSGHMAGIYARVDIERGVHKAPANEVIQSIDATNGFHGLEVEITKREQDLLNPVGIDALRWFPNRGTRVWGARTVSSDGSWKYVNVRRLFIFVERSIDEGTQWVVFEPNDEKTWARVRQSITNFLTTVWRSGALFGTKAEEAFFVRCDRTTMTQDDIDNGRLICVIGIAPVKPAEFVIFRIQQKLIDQTQP
jgi:phage tail sheath protein FI